MTLTPTGHVGWSRRQHRERERIHRGGLCLDGGEQCRLGHHLERRRRDRERDGQLFDCRQHGTHRTKCGAHHRRTNVQYLSGCRLHLRDLSEQPVGDVGRTHRDRFVTAGTGCAWTAASSASWITVTSGASGSGNGSVGYSIAANTTISSRAGIVTIAGQAFTVTQAGMCARRPFRQPACRSPRHLRRATSRFQSRPGVSGQPSTMHRGCPLRAAPAVTVTAPSPTASPPIPTQHSALPPLR